MKKAIAMSMAIVLLVGLMLPTAAESWDDKVVLDETVFFEKPEIIASCMCSRQMYLNHLLKDGILFFEWCGDDEKMPEEIGGCFKSGTIGKTVVFLNGVPNFVKDLFKASEGDTHDVYIPDSVTEIDEDCFVKGSHITLHFTKNNTVALAYAQTRGMSFEVMDGERVPGDIDFNKSVDMKDVLALRKSIARIHAAYEIYSTDLNADGSTDMKDVLSLRKQIAHAA